VTNEELQALALELPSLNPATDGERIRTIEAAITDYELSFLKDIGGNAYFPLLKKHNGAIPFNVFWDIFIDVLMHFLRKYDPARNNTFSNAFGYLLNLRVNGYWKKYYGGNAAVPFSSLTTTNGDGEEQEFDKADDTYAPDRLLDAADEFASFLMVAPLVALRKAQEQHLRKSQKSYFEGFFTFDTIKQTKDGLFDEASVISENNVLFPIMEFVVLDYLLEGKFKSMRDVVKNKVKDTERLKQRVDTMGACYGLSKPTVVGRNKLYRQMFDAVIG
jgi:hypothetical protein